MDDDDRGDGLSRLGFAAHGVYYVLLAVLAGLVAAGDDGTDASASGALESVARQPFGRWLLVPIAVGFLAYGVHRVREAYHGDGWWRLVEGVRASVWLGLTGLALRTVAGGGRSGSSGDTEQSVTRAVLELPGGRVLVGAVGLVILGVGAYQGWTALTERLDDELEQLDLEERRAVHVLGSVGYAGRAFAYGSVGVFVTLAAIRHDSSSSRGLDGALQELLRGPAGEPMVWAVTVGFLAFGLFRLVESRYRFDDG